MSRSKGVSDKTHTQAQRDHYANQHNPNNAAHKADRDNHANQLNPNNHAYEQSRSESGKNNR